MLAQNRTGFKNLVRLASAASLEGFYFKPRIDKEILAAYSEGIICLSGCVSSEFSRAILKGYDTEAALQEAIEVTQWFQSVFKDRYFIEIMNNNLEIQRQQMAGAIEVANRVGIPWLRPVMRTTWTEAMLKFKTFCCASQQGNFEPTAIECKWKERNFISAPPKRCMSIS